MRVHEGDDADLHEALAGAAPVALPEADSEIEDWHEDALHEIDPFFAMLLVGLFLN